MPISLKTLLKALHIDFLSFVFLPFSSISVMFRLLFFFPIFFLMKFHFSFVVSIFFKKSSENWFCASFNFLTKDFRFSSVSSTWVCQFFPIHTSLFLHSILIRNWPSIVINTICSQTCGQMLYNSKKFEVEKLKVTAFYHIRAESEYKKGFWKSNVFLFYQTFYLNVNGFEIHFSHNVRIDCFRVIPPWH